MYTRAERKSCLTGNPHAAQRLALSALTLLFVVKLDLCNNILVFYLILVEIALYMLLGKRSCEMKNRAKNAWPSLRAKLFRMVSVGVIDEPVNQAYDVISTGALIANLAVAVMATFDNLNAAYGPIFDGVEHVTVAFFAVDFILRLLTAPELYPNEVNKTARLKYCTSVAGIIDLFSFLPYYLPFFFPAGVAAFRMFRVIRILRLFRINAYYDSLNVITEVLKSKKQQLLSSVFIIALLMLGSSLCMYSLEHEAQPEVFSNAFSGIWWASSTLLTVGYGDIYPITPLGKFFSIVITFLGVGMVAIPTGIISAGFVEQYTQFKLLGEYQNDDVLSFLRIRIAPGDIWTGKRIGDLVFPEGMIVAIIIRDHESIVPHEDVVLEPGDILVLGAEPLSDSGSMELKEIAVGENHNWNGFAVKELDISRQSYIVLVRRANQMIVPYGSLVLEAGDKVYMYKNVEKRNVVS